MKIVDGLRAHSERPFKTRWMPVDLVCDVDGTEVLVRTKLVRGPESLGVSIAESVCHGIFEALGFSMAEPFAVQIGPQFAADLTAQYGFDTPVRPGTHWGTRLMQKDVLEIEFSADEVALLRDPSVLFRLYLLDGVIGNPDRATHGNVLLRRYRKTKTMELIPIDQSDAFFHPSALLDRQRLLGRKDHPAAGPLPGTEGTVLIGGVELVENAFDEVEGSRGRIAGQTNRPIAEWYVEANVDRATIEEFLDHRIGNLRVIARFEHWIGMAGLAGAGGALVLDL